METDTPSVLLPCAICSRTFMPRSLEKHVKICERAITKKRKPFDSAKQRIQGTDLAEFLPRPERKRSLYEEKRKSSWKETHDDFLRTIRAARGRTTDTEVQVRQSEQSGQRQSSSHASSGVPMRANEKGTCPTCSRRFGVKAYERHVAWCKERSTRLPNHFPATNNVAKERLEARMKYRAPMLKNRRASNREKYSQGSTSAPNIVSPNAKTITTIESIRNIAPRSNLSRTRDTLSVGDTRRSDKSNESQRSTLTNTGRGESLSQAQISTEALERTSTAKRSSNHVTSSRPKSSSRSIGLPASRTLRLPLRNSLSRKNLENEAESLENDPVQRPLLDADKVQLKTLEGNAIGDRRTNCVKSQAENWNTERKSRVSRTRSESKVNDVTVNEDVLGMLVKPCKITYKDDRCIAWEKISRDKVECHSFVSMKNQTKHEDYLSIEEETPPCDLLSTPSSAEDTVGNVAWSSAVRKLNRTYLIKDSVDHDDQENALTRRSPRLEFPVINPRSDTLSIDESVPGIIDKIDNEDVVSLETKDIFEEKNCSCLDTRSLGSEASSRGRKDSFQDDPPSTIKSAIDLSEKLCRYENKYKDKSQLEERDEEANEKSQKLSEEPCTNLIENLIVSETCEFEDRITDLERIEILSCSSYPPEVKNNLCNVQDDSQSITAQEYIFERSFNNNSEEEKRRKLENNSSVVEYFEKNDSLGLDELVENEGEKTNAKDLVDRDKESVEENRSEIVEIDNTRDSIEETQFIAITNTRMELERPLPIPIPIHRLHLIRIDSKIQKNMNLLRGSTDTLISSVEAVDLTNGRRSNELHRNSSEEENNNNDPYKHNRSEKARILPAIKADRTDTTFFRERSPRNSGRSYWEKASKFSNDNLVRHDYRQNNRLRKRNPKTCILPPVLIDHSPRMQSGTCKGEYDPFLLAERQMHDLLLSDSTDLILDEDLSDHGLKGSTKSRESFYPLSHSSAFVDYPSHDKISTTVLDKLPTTIETTSTRSAELDEQASDFSSDSTETNSLSREIFLRDFHDTKERDRQRKDSPNNNNNRTPIESSKRELGRRMILDKSIVLGNEKLVQEDRSNRIERRLGNIKVKPSKVLRSTSNHRSQPIRAYSAPKSIYAKSKSTDDGREGESLNVEKRDRPSILDNDGKNDYITLSGSDLSLSSIVSSEVDIKRSNSVFDELITSFEDDVLGNDSFPSLRSLLRNESLRAYDNSPVHGSGTRQRHDDRISDEEYSSPDNYKQQEQKFNADSAYSSLNRKSNYSNHGRSTNDGQNRFEDNSSRNNRREKQTTSISAGKTKCRMSRFCHECGSKFPETAKFCCQCGVKRLTL